MRTLWRTFGYVRPYLGQLILGGVLLAISGALMAAVVSTGKPLVNQVLLPGVTGATPPGGEADVEADIGADILSKVRSWLPMDEMAEWAKQNAFVQVPILILIIFFVRGVFHYFGQYLTIKVGVSVLRDLRVDLHARVIHQSLKFFHTHRTGQILSRILNDVTLLRRIATVVLADLVRTATMVPFLILTAFYHDWRMSIFTILALPLMGLPMVRLGQRLRRASTASLESLALVANRLTESVSGIRVVQGFGMEKYEIDRFREGVNRMLRADFKAGRARSLAPSIMELAGAMVGAGLFYFAGQQINRGNLDAGNFTVVLFCLGMLVTSTRRLNTLYAEIQLALAASVRVFDILDTEQEIRDRPGARPLPPLARGIQFDQVEFSYGDETVLDGIDLIIEKGEMIALVGASGSGKSTLANLVPRFYDPTAGRILMDGIDLRDATLASVRMQVALVTQETILFDDTVRNNIAYGRSEITLEQVMEVARAARAHEFVEKLPQGYDTMLGEGGSRLSMGQRQRITIARALLRNAPILILDEATSALDSESEALVQRALDELMKGRTSLVIAHRLATVRRADRILVMDYGRIVESGTHQELVARGGVYARLHALQFREAG